MDLDRARAIAGDARADVVVWVSGPERGREALWIYDVASDRASARRLAMSPPFDATTAAAVALAVKTLLRGTVVAPPHERLDSVPIESTWRLGLEGGAAVHIGTSWLPESRFGLYGATWPMVFHERVGVSLGVESGYGLQVDDSAFTGSIHDSAVRLGISWRFPLSRQLAFQPSIDGSVHWVRLDGTLLATRAHVTVDRGDAGLEPRMALTLALFGGRLLVGPWVGLAFLTRSQRFFVHGTPVAELAPVSLESAMRVEIAFP